MSRKLAIVSISAALITMLSLVVLIPIKADPQSEEWVPYIPDADQIRLEYWAENGSSYMNVSIVFRSSGYYVSRAPKECSYLSIYQSLIIRNPDDANHHCSWLPLRFWTHQINETSAYDLQGKMILSVG